MALVAKPIVKNHLWVITDGSTKVGNIEANDAAGFNVKIGDNVNYFSTTKKIEQGFELAFEKPAKSTPSVNVSFAYWPTTGNTHNNFYDVKRKIHVYTKSIGSKCYYAAGYFNIHLNGEWKMLFCPKYIFLQRYTYSGPFLTPEQADAASN